MSTIFGHGAVVSRPGVLAQLVAIEPAHGRSEIGRGVSALAASMAAAPDALENFLAMHGDGFGRLDAQAHLIVALHPRAQSRRRLIQS
jgi:hypothetical protein